ncbi:MAG: flagellar protein FlgN [Pseudomonadota bacterium]
MQSSNGYGVTDASRTLDVLAHALTELSEALAAEREVLADPGAKGLDAVSAHKRQAVIAVERAERARQELAPDSAGELWDRVLRLAEHCRHQNLTNGALLALRKRHADRLLGALRGDQQPATYGAEGFVVATGELGRTRVTA